MAVVVLLLLAAAAPPEEVLRDVPRSGALSPAARGSAPVKEEEEGPGDWPGEVWVSGMAGWGVLYAFEPVGKQD